MTIRIGAIPPASAVLSKAAAAAPKVPSSSAYAAPGALGPDFATMFAPDEHAGPVLRGRCPAGLDDECAACLQLVTPRLAWLLSAGAELLRDCWEEAAEAGLLEERLEGMLPPVAIRYAERTPGWLGHLLGAVRDIKLTLAAGEVPEPNSTAEEIALHLVLAQANCALEAVRDSYDMDDDDLFGTFFALPPHIVDADSDADDLGWALEAALADLSDLLFEDHDVLMLFDASLDGIEGDAEMVERMGLVNLHPADWFTPFRDLAADSAGER